MIRELPELLLNGSPPRKTMEWGVAGAHAVLSAAQDHFHRHRNASARAAYEAELAAAAVQLPGGTAATALVVASSSQIEPQVGRFTCLACDARMDLVQHRAPTEDGIAVRALDLACRQCGGPRTAYFHIERPS